MDHGRHRAVRVRRVAASGARTVSTLGVVALVVAAASPSAAGVAPVPPGSPTAPASTTAVVVPADDPSGPPDVTDLGTSVPDEPAVSGPDPSAARRAIAPHGGVPAGAALPLGASGIPARVLVAYRAAAGRVAQDDPGCAVPWWLLAGVGEVESGHAAGGRVDAGGRTRGPIRGPVLDGSTPGTAVVPDSDRGVLDGDPVHDRALGPMQFMPGTWASAGADGDGDGVRDPDDVDDATLAAARYLCAGGGSLAARPGQVAALMRYNRSTSYGLTVLRWAATYRDGAAAMPGATGPAGVEPAPVPPPAPSTAVSPAPVPSSAEPGADSPPPAEPEAASPSPPGTGAPTQPGPDPAAGPTADPAPGAVCPVGTDPGGPADPAPPAPDLAAPPPPSPTGAPPATSTPPATDASPGTTPSAPDQLVQAAPGSDDPSPRCVPAPCPTVTTGPPSPTAAPSTDVPASITGDGASADPATTSDDPVPACTVPAPPPDGPAGGPPADPSATARSTTSSSAGATGSG